jgi:hypothetical protein
MGVTLFFLQLHQLEEAVAEAQAGRLGQEETAVLEVVLIDFLLLPV